MTNYAPCKDCLKHDMYHTTRDIQDCKKWRKYEAMRKDLRRNKNGKHKDGVD